LVVVEMAVHTLVAASFRGCHIRLQSKNPGIISALQHDMSHNSSQNRIVHQLLNLFFDNDIWLTVEYVSTKSNPADGPSRG
ncbi:hypothetical protein DFH07DRAFT_679597, partial [Mycena maculata]